MGVALDLQRSARKAAPLPVPRLLKADVRGACAGRGSAGYSRAVRARRIPSAGRAEPTGSSGAI